MKRFLLLVTVAAMLASAMVLSGVAQAAPIGDSADARCAKLARQTLGPSYKPATYTFIGGTEGNDNFSGSATDGPDVFCGFGGDFDVITTLDEGDIFLGGAGRDLVGENYGTFYGEEGSDIVENGNTGTVYGGAGNDRVYYNDQTGTFYGGADDDNVDYNYGTFYGEEGSDNVFEDYGTFVQ